MHSLILRRLKFISECVEPGATLLKDDSAQITMDELLDVATGLAKRIQALNVQSVVAEGENSIQWIVLDLACQIADVIFMPLPSFFSLQQRQHCILQLQPDLIFSEDKTFAACLTSITRGIAAFVWPDVDRYQGWQASYEGAGSVRVPKGTQKITFTSGSTGNPKGVCLSLAHQWQVAESLADAIGLQQPRHLSLLPLATLLENIGGVYVPMLCGGAIALPGAKSRGLLGSSGLDRKAFLQAIQDHAPNTLILTPQLLQVMVGSANQGWTPPQTLQFAAVGGGKVSPQLIEKARALGIPAYEGYGLSECGSVVALNTPAYDKQGAAGRILPHCRVDVVDQEVVVSGAAFLGYINEPESFELKQVQTGDLGRVENDILFINGRKKNLIISSFGRNINPEWVESELMAQSLLSHVVVLGDQRPYLVALVGACESVPDQSIENLMERINKTLPDYAQIGHWMRLPQADWASYTTANGRPKRGRIEQAYQQDIDSMYSASEIHLNQ